MYQSPTVIECHEASQHLALATNHEEVNSLKVLFETIYDPEAPPTHILRDELLVGCGGGASTEVARQQIGDTSVVLFILMLSVR